MGIKGHLNGQNETRGAMYQVFSSTWFNLKTKSNIENIEVENNFPASVRALHNMQAASLSLTTLTASK